MDQEGLAQCVVVAIVRCTKDFEMDHRHYTQELATFFNYHSTMYTYTNTVVKPDKSASSS